MLVIGAQDSLQIAINVDEVLKTLPSRYEKIIRMRWLGNKTREEVAVHLKVSVSTIVRWENIATDLFSSPERLRKLYVGVICSRNDR